MFKCPNCGGTLVFDVGMQKLVCRYCRSEINVEDYKVDNSVQADAMSVYTCSDCGARLISPDQSAVAFCSYCGSQKILEERMQEKLDPQKIIPFKVPKSTCINNYKNTVKKIPYMPKELKDAEFLENFRGVYIPYWRLKTGFTDEPLKLKGYSYARSGEYVYTREFRVEANLGSRITGLPYDASSSFDDAIAESIAPYRQKSIRNYRPGYLAGFCADLPDVDPEIYRKEAEEKAVEEAVSAIKNTFSRKSDITVSLPDSKKKLRELLKPHPEATAALYLPVWFLTWRRRDRVAYMVMNGETGEAAMDIPVSLGSFFAVSALTAGILFALMTLFVSMTAPTALLLSMTLSTAAMMLYQRQTKKIHDRETHVFDRGYFIEGRDTEISERRAERIRRRRLRNTWAVPAVVVTVFLLLLEWGVYAVADGMPDERAQVASFFLFPVAAYNVLRALTFTWHIREKSVILEILAGAFGILYGYYVLYTLQVHDYMYYIGCILCIGSVLLSSIGMIRKYNLLATRPLPTFFDRTGGDVHEE